MEFLNTVRVARRLAAEAERKAARRGAPRFTPARLESGQSTREAAGLGSQSRRPFSALSVLKTTAPA